jgi:hypothetical protein
MRSRGLPGQGAVLLGTLLVSLSANATFITNDISAAADTTITFDEVVLENGTPLTDQYSAFGVEFDGAWYNPVGISRDCCTAANFQAPDGPKTFENPFSILFNSNVSAVSFSLATNPGTSKFEALLDGTVVESMSVTTAAPASFYGFSDIVFDALRTTAPLDTNKAARFDTISYRLVTVPEPATLLLLALGLAIIGLAGWHGRLHQA